MKTIQIDQFLDFKSISNLVANPSKTYYAYLVSKTDIEKNQYTYTLHIKGNEIIKPLDIKTSSQFIWENDHQILFPFEKTKEDKKLKKDQYTIYYRYDLLKEQISKAYTFKMPTSIIKVLNHGKVDFIVSIKP
jgi:hypothetical protein